jgi:SAM-dependent methyltransferase
MHIRDILRAPLVYQAFQQGGGFFGARLKAMKSYLSLNAGEKVVDIGCGPGFIVKYLPPDISYWGFDTDEKYISYATEKFGSKGRFVCHLFDEPTARKHAPVDVVTMNGVLHHLSDDQAHETLAVIKQALGTRGRLFTLDGCFVDGQPALARYLLEHDRGEYVRTPERYESLLRAHFDRVETHVEHSLSWVPYTWLIMIGHK